MNKTAIKNFAVWARQKLISDITYKAGMLGVTEDGIAEKLPHSTPDLEFYDIGTKNYAEVSGKEIKQRNALVNAIRKKEKENGDYKSAFRYVVEEVAYTWFNRLIAIRFMEVNDYLPSGVRVLSSENKAKKEPDLVTTPFDTDLEFTSYEQDRILQLKDDNKLDELFRMLFIKQCNKLHDILPELFEKTADYTELLLTVSFTDGDGVLYHLVHDIDEDDFNVEKEGQVQIIGWLYQYYNTELNAVVYDGNMSKSRIPKELLPAATTIYTPDWAIRYMVENSLGRLWLEGHPNAKLHDSWKYYLDEAQQDQSVEVQLQALRAEYKTIKPEEIKVIDPCMGSGHILVYAFDVLMQIYLECGYTEREAVSLILQNNLFGLDIDDRAYQLAYFAVMMKARQYDRRFLTRGIQPNLYSIRESNGIQAMTVEYFHKNDPKLKADMESIIMEMQDAKEYGSILNITPVDFAGLYARFDEISNDFSIQRESVRNQLLPLVKCAEVLVQKYDVVVTNPPYLGSSRFSTKLNDFVIANYPDVKADLSMVMYKHALRDMCQKNGFVSFITTTSWMFLSSFEKLRSFVLAGYDFESLVDFGTELFEGKVGHNPIVAWVNRKSHTDHAMTGIRLVDYCYSRRDEKETEFFNKRNYHYPKQSNFSKIPGSPVAYWVSERFIQTFMEGSALTSIAPTRKGMFTGNNDLWLKLWFEVNEKKIPHQFKPYNKGGEFRRWYGNHDYIINWSNDGQDVLAYKGAGNINTRLYFKPCITWSLVTSYKASFRLLTDKVHVMGDAGPIASVSEADMYYILGLLNSKYVEEVVALIAPTINFSNGAAGDIPVIFDESRRGTAEFLSKQCVDVSCRDWNSYETSWDFKRNPLV